MCPHFAAVEPSAAHKMPTLTGTNKHTLRLQHLLPVLLLFLFSHAADFSYGEEISQFALDARGSEFPGLHEDEQEGGEAEFLAARLLGELSDEVERRSSAAYAQLFRHDDNVDDDHQYKQEMNHIDSRRRSLRMSVPIPRPTACPQCDTTQCNGAGILVQDLDDEYNCGGDLVSGLEYTLRTQAPGFARQALSASERARIAANNAAAGIELPQWAKDLLPGGVIPTIPPLPALNISNNISQCIRLTKASRMKCSCLADYSGGNCTGKREMTCSAALQVPSWAPDYMTCLKQRKADERTGFNPELNGAPPCLLVDLASSKPHSMPFKVGCRFLKQPNRRCNGTVLSDRIFRTIESITLAEILANRTANSCPAPFRTAYGVAAGIEINASCAGQVERPEAPLCSANAVPSMKARPSPARYTGADSACEKALVEYAEVWSNCRQSPAVADYVSVVDAAYKRCVDASLAKEPYYGLSCVESSFKYEVANQFIKLSSPLPTIQATWDIYNFERFYDDPSQQVQTLSGENMNGKEDVDFSFTPSELANTGQFPAGRACGEVRMGSSDSWVKFDPVPHTDPLFEFFCLDDKNWEEPLAGFAAGTTVAIVTFIIVFGIAGFCAWSFLSTGTKAKLHHDDVGDTATWPQDDADSRNGGVLGRVEPIPSVAASAASAAASACLPMARAATHEASEDLNGISRRDSMKGLLSRDDEDAMSEASTLPPGHGE